MRRSERFIFQGLCVTLLLIWVWSYFREKIWRTVPVRFGQCSIRVSFSGKLFLILFLFESTCKMICYLIWFWLLNRVFIIEVIILALLRQCVFCSRSLRNDVACFFKARCFFFLGCIFPPLNINPKLDWLINYALSHDPWISLALPSQILICQVLFWYYIVYIFAKNPATVAYTGYCNEL